MENKNEQNEQFFGNTKKNRSQLNRICFTLNNWNESEFEQIHEFCKMNAKIWIIGKEIGELGTPHLQGFIKVEKKIDFNKWRKILGDRAHIEKCKCNDTKNLNYCAKDGNYVTNYTFPPSIKEQTLEKEYKDVIWKDWQNNILNILNEEPDNRKIFWVYETQGNVGKSFLCKYILLKYKNALIGCGKQNDIFNQINTFMNEHKTQTYPKIILLDIPRYYIDSVNYGCIEMIKNGCLYSGKYEGGMCIFPIPHVIIFANEPPIKERMSQDRWDIIKI